jgi:hypothetical protein
MVKSGGLGYLSSSLSEYKGHLLLKSEKGTKVKPRRSGMY